MLFQASSSWKKPFIFLQLMKWASNDQLDTFFFPIFKSSVLIACCDPDYRWDKCTWGNSPSQGRNNWAQGVWASVTEQAEWGPLCAMPENWEKAGQVVERQPAALKAQPLSLWTCSLTFPSAATTWRRDGEKYTEERRRDTGTMSYVRNAK